MPWLLHIHPGRWLVRRTGSLYTGAAIRDASPPRGAGDRVPEAHWCGQRCATLIERYIALGALVMAACSSCWRCWAVPRERLLAALRSTRGSQAGVALPVAVAFVDFGLRALAVARWLISFWPGMIVFAAPDGYLHAWPCTERGGAALSRPRHHRRSRCARRPVRATLTDSEYSVLGFFDDYVRWARGSALAAGRAGRRHDMPSASSLGR